MQMRMRMRMQLTTPIYLSNHRTSPYGLTILYNQQSSTHTHTQNKKIHNSPTLTPTISNPQKPLRIIQTPRRTHHTPPGTRNLNPNIRRPDTQRIPLPIPPTHNPISPRIILSLLGARSTRVGVIFLVGQVVLCDFKVAFAGGTW